MKNESEILCLNIVFVYVFLILFAYEIFMFQVFLTQVLLI